MKVGKLYSIKLSHNSDNFKGIIQDIGEEWILLYRLFTDFMMDGYLLLKKEYIEEVVRDQDVFFTEEVLIAKGIPFINSIKDIPLNDTNSLLKWLKENQIVFMFSLKDKHVSYVGKIEKILAKSFYLQYLDVNGKWGKEKLLYRTKTVRSIDFKSDYIESLLAYNNANNPISGCLDTSN